MAMPDDGKRPIEAARQWLSGGSPGVREAQSMRQTRFMRSITEILRSQHQSESDVVEKRVLLQPR